MKCMNLNVAKLVVLHNGKRHWWKVKITLLFNDKFWLPKIKNNYKHKQNWEKKKKKSFASLGVGSLLSVVSHHSNMLKN